MAKWHIRRLFWGLGNMPLKVGNYCTFRREFTYWWASQMGRKTALEMRCF